MATTMVEARFLLRWDDDTDVRTDWLVREALTALLGASDRTIVRIPGRYVDIRVEATLITAREAEA